MRCEQAQNLFDAYLDGELSPALETELAAHRLQCEECRHALALLEVVGHVVEADRDDEPTLDDAFSERLLSCLEESGVIRRMTPRKLLAGIGLLAAAAAVAVVGLVALRGPEPRVAGVRRINPAPKLDRAANEAVERFEATWNDRIDQARNLIDFGEMSIMQVLERLGIDEADRSHKPFEVMPDSFDELAPGHGTAGDVEDL